MKVMFRVLAVLAALLTALALGWDPASGARTGSKRTTTSSATHSRATPHTASHGHTSRFAIDDDDSYDDEEIVESGVLAPERWEIDGDATPREPARAKSHVPPTVMTAAAHVTRPGIRPSGEHRGTTDRPPRA
jgi:hypothetical protein